MSTILKALVVMLSLGVFMSAAAAQFSRPEDAIKYRQSVMFLIGQHIGRLAAMVKGAQPYDREAFVKNAVIVEQLSALPWEAFLVAGSDRGKTTMKSSVLEEPPKFRAASQQFRSATGKLVAAAEGGDFSALKGQFGAVAKSCKNCHSRFRK